ncbi:hypothetical protein QFC19_008913 [Naganishia cerealis]|uniref:Uncharacterized protein n=1 Tax=Naganishia cerealis TaxID=610337 RepID=A0ACC2UYN1_9TREE|nr:hypothetical protein QFC19_008913 [Naganishia cerealis]
MSTVDPLSTSVQQWLFSPIQLTRTPSQQPSTNSTTHPDDSWTFQNEYQKRREAIMFLMAVQKDLQYHNPVKQQVDQWKFQQKAHEGTMRNMQQGGIMAMDLQGMPPAMGMGVPYGRPNPMQMSMGMQQQGRYGQHPTNSKGIDLQVNLDTMPMKDLLAHSGVFGHVNSAEYLHWVNVNQEFEQVPYARDVAYTAASYLQRFFMRRSLRDYKAKEIAVACLYLALKAEERMNIKIRVVARAFKAKLGQMSAQTDYFENTIAQYEDLVLETLCYDLSIPQPLGYVLRAHSFLYPPSVSLDDMSAGKEKRKEKEREKKQSVWDEDGDTWGFKNQISNKYQQQIQRQHQEKQDATHVKAKKRQAAEEMKGEELYKAALLDLAYLICDET